MELGGEANLFIYISDSILGNDFIIQNVDIAIAVTDARHTLPILADTADDEPTANTNRRIHFYSGRPANRQRWRVGGCCGVERQ